MVVTIEVAAAVVVTGILGGLALATIRSFRIRALNACLERHDRTGLRKKARLTVVDGVA